MSRRILFVDDEALVLQGLQRSLRPMRKQWEMEFATSGAEALETMARAHFDVVITDMRMPGMDGAQLLDQVKIKFPQTVRMVLSGQSDRETILRSVGPTHQYLSKPCEIEELKQKLTHAFALRDLLADPRLKEVVSSLETVPSLPSLYVAMSNVLQSPDSSITDVGNIVVQDMGMSMKMLQLVNSAFFGLTGNISNPKQAVALLGIDNIKALVLSVHVFSQLEHSLTQEMSFLWKHCMATAGLADKIAKQENSSRNTIDDSFTAGLLHDIGRLVLAAVYKEQYAQILQPASPQPDKTSSIYERERELLGCTHAAVGAYLLGLWGLPDPIVEAVAWHHEPALSGTTSFGALIAVHAANCYDHEIHGYSDSLERPALDEPLLDRLGLAARPAVWRQAGQELAERAKKI